MLAPSANTQYSPWSASGATALLVFVGALFEDRKGGPGQYLRPGPPGVRSVNGDGQVVVRHDAPELALVQDANVVAASGRVDSVDDAINVEVIEGDDVGSNGFDDGDDGFACGEVGVQGGSFRSGECLADTTNVTHLFTSRKVRGTSFETQKPPVPKD